MVRPVASTLRAKAVAHLRQIDLLGTKDAAEIEENLRIHAARGSWNPGWALYDHYVVAVGQSLRHEKAGSAESESSPPCSTTVCHWQTWEGGENEAGD